jgi:hypothetical protein
VEVQNVTVTLPAELLRQARHLAVDEGVSLSRFVTMLLEERVAAASAYAAARDRHRQLLQEGFPLGTDGEAIWDRAELHDR